MNVRQTLILWFWLNKQRIKNGKKVIYLRITVNEKRSEFSTGQYIEENWWDHKQQRVNARHPDATNINRVLDVIRSDIQRHFSLIIARQENVTADAVKNVYLGIKEKEYNTLRSVWNA